MSTNPFPLVPPDPDEMIETPAAPPRPRPSYEEIAAWIILGGLFLFVMFRHLVPGVVGGLAVWLKEHAETLKLAGSTVSLGLVHMLMGMLLAVLVFFRHVTHHVNRVPGTLSAALEQKMERFTSAFARIASAQVKISFLNTSLTALYLLVALPLFGQHIPFATTIVFVTFVCGLIPVLGNLISNTVIVILSLGISPGTAMASLLFLVIIHKLEYLTNSRIVGGETDSQAWE